jgi:hypothetical protein
MRTSNINWWRVVLATIIYVVIAQVIHTVGAMATMKYYLMEEYFPVWSKLMMPTAGPPPASFYAYSIFYELIAAFLFVLVFVVLKDGLPGRGAAKKGLIYGLIVFALAGLPGVLSMHLMINLPAALFVWWGFEMLVIYLLGGMITAKLNK